MATTAPHRPHIAPFNSARHDRMCRIGLWLGVLGAGLAAVPGFSDGSVVEQGVRRIFYEPNAFIWMGGTFAVLIGLSVLLPYAWARITGIGLLSVAAFAYGVIIVGARSDEELLVGPEITLGPTGKMELIAYLVTCAGLVLALVGAPRMGRTAVIGADGQPIPGTSGYAITSMVLSICGLVTLFTAPLGIAFAVAAFDDMEQSKGARGGRGMAIAGLVIGIVIVALGALGLSALIGVADPSLNEG